jgi:hypothetical protein
LTPFERKYHIILDANLVFIDASENLVMADNVATPLNPSIAPIEQKELEEVPLEVNVSQRLCKEEPSR